MSLIVAGVLALYALVGIVAVVAAARYAKARGRSAARWGWGAAAIVVLIPFWDWLPTAAMHRYYCATDARFQTYKSPEQWRKEHPGVMETLTRPASVRSRHEEFDGGRGKKTVYPLNDRFRWIVTQQEHSRLLPLVRTEEVVLDVKEDKVLARYVDFSAGNSLKPAAGLPRGWKFWLQSAHCAGGRENQRALRNLRIKFQ